MQEPGPSQYKVQPLSSDLQEHLRKTLKSKTLAKNEYLLKEGDTSRRVSFIESGLLRCFYLSKGKDVNRWFMSEGDVVFSVSSFYMQQPSYEYIQALEPSQLFYITHDELYEIYYRFPEFQRIGLVLTGKYYLLSDQLSFVKSKPPRERYEWLVTNQQELLQRVASKHLASYLGITSEYFSRIKRK
ncbi:hypothetical protein A4H97_29940 [Niastella yeongjuensis]|uniref:Cyclic nucleotide-binding domain-containing protein n=1 Tax=Niastella yeongjuensis TaxID=354355 RepID=A0A1V9EPQ1_9BACT|nr:hypothetical protein A4H97_29940 [Niastella yeongjuensis]